MSSHPIYEYTYENDGKRYRISTDRQALDLEVIHAYLTRSYWSPGVPKEQVDRAVEHSLCFGMYDISNATAQQQIGFARVITDYVSYAYLADVFVLSSYRGQGLGKWLMEIIVNCPAIEGIRSFFLATRDAHGLYSQFGFTELPEPKKIMARYYEMSWYAPEMAME